MEKKTEDRVYIPVSPAELIDKLTILEIKLSEINDDKKLKNIHYEYDLLTSALNDSVKQSPELAELREALQVVNKLIWDSEDALRVFWKTNDFGEEYVKHTTNSHKENDNRSKIKRKINDLLGSSIVEEKSHQNL